MAPRHYEQRQRQEQVDATRARIVAAARDLLIRNGFHRARVADIAREAGVTRATVYNQFESKGGVLDAVLTQALERGGLSQLIAILAVDDARAQMLSAFDQSTRLWAHDADLFRRIIGLVAVDPDAQRIIAHRDAERISAQQFIAARLGTQHYLRRGWDTDRMTALLILLTSFATFDSLTTYGKLSTEEVIRLQIDLAADAVWESPHPPGEHGAC
jgi:AcrR family transcriptional regulator